MAELNHRLDPPIAASMGERLVGVTGRKWVAAAVLAAAGLMAPSGQAGTAADLAAPYQVKAAFLANFPKFVQWPPSRHPAPAAPLVIGVIGADPFGPYLREAVAGRSIDGHPLEVRPTTRHDLRQVHVAFVSPDIGPWVRDIARDAQSAGVLTVGDSAGFAEAGLVLNLYVDQRRVRFEVNQAAAQRAGLRLSAQLLQMARLVSDGQ